MSTAALLTLAGDVIALGDATAEDVAPFVGKPSAALALSDGRQMLITGLTEAECRALAPMFLRQVALTMVAA